MNTYAEKQYLISKCLDTEILLENTWFNPYIDPENGYIPKCSVCSEDFDGFKRDIKDILTLPDEQHIVKWKHTSACLWFDYFSDKASSICPTIKIKMARK